ncbi:MAG: hypothetical protein FD127_4458, partial [Acidimicrobiaceae bacterium]
TMSQVGTTTVWAFTETVAGSDDGAFSTSIGSGLDRAGNPNMGLTTNQTFTVDATAPGVTMTYDRPSAPLTKVATGPLVITARFSEAIDGGAATPSITIRRPGAADETHPLVRGSSAAVWSYTYGVLPSPVFGNDGTVQLDIIAADGGRSASRSRARRTSG